MLKEDPSILTEAIEANPDKFIEAMTNAVQKAKVAKAKEAEESAKKELEGFYENPLKPEIRPDDIIRGTKGAPLTLVEYSDFECGYCARGFQTVQALLDKYPGKIQFIYKHLPLSFHPQAMISAQYYEAARLQSHQKAQQFHDAIFAEQSGLRNGVPFLQKIAEKIDLNMDQLKKDADSEAVKKRIEADMKEAGKFNFQGTPGFVFNGIPVKGAYPVSHFEGIVKELEKRGLVKI